MMTVEQMMSAHRSNVETLFGLGTTAFSGLEQFIELNVEATRAAMNDAAGTAQALLAVKDPQEFVAVQASLVQPWPRSWPPTAAASTRSPPRPARK